ncbi:transcriptional repressor [Staphylococcus agnetis]|uniref:helix-turn-helix domain-containing protein n=1 Tax=Staphylococcus agnetis TaxID=985762 RepID=UPI000E03FD01|nr:helix-turn-helix transcriptional regulator [Staphylococcus agnetis]SUK14682.1 transcriptional repressor [Staphylococcus agnetis]
MKPDIKSRRLELNLTLEQVGNMVGVGKSTVRKWETGDIENMRRDKIVKLAKALRVSPSFIMGFEDDKEVVQEQDQQLSNSKQIDNLAAHLDGDFTEEELAKIREYAEMVRKARD